MVRRRVGSRLVPCAFLLSFSILLTYSPVLISAKAIVTLDSIVIFKTHEWFPAEPTVIFHCKGEDKIILPDVKQTNAIYNFKGEESWQPLTKLKNEKCKRCGFYERNAIKTEHVFDEWELCPAEFKKSNGKYTRVKIGEFNATFLCPECIELLNDDKSTTFSVQDYSKYIYWALIAVIAAALSIVLIAGIITAYKYWQQRMRQKQQARFLQMFEEADDIEDELGIGPTGGSH